MYKIFLDLDGVLTDFMAMLHTEFPLVTEDEPDEKFFWECVSNVPNFWTKMPWYPGGRELWNVCKKYDCEILTAVPYSDEERAILGKTEWVNKHLREMPINFVKQALLKARYAAPNHILIDDRADVINAFKNRGGIGIHHTSINSTLKQLDKILNPKSLDKLKLGESVTL